MPHAIDAGDRRHDSRPLPWRSRPVGARCRRCRDYRRPGGHGCRRRHAAGANLQLPSRLVLPTGITFGFFGGIQQTSQRCRDRWFSYFCWRRDCAARRSPREASLYLVVSAGVLAILLTASRQFDWLDVTSSRQLRCYQSCSACPSDNICAIKLRLRHSRSWC